MNGNRKKMLNQKLKSTIIYFNMKLSNITHCIVDTYILVHNERIMIFGTDKMLQLLSQSKK